MSDDWESSEPLREAWFVAAGRIGEEAEREYGSLLGRSLAPLRSAFEAGWHARFRWLDEQSFNLLTAMLLASREECSCLAPAEGGLGKPCCEPCELRYLMQRGKAALERFEALRDDA